MTSDGVYPKTVAAPSLKKMMRWLSSTQTIASADIVTIAARIASVIASAVFGAADSVMRGKSILAEREWSESATCARCKENPYFEPGGTGTTFRIAPDRDESVAPVAWIVG